MSEKLEAILKPLMDYEKWLSKNHEGFQRAQKSYDEAQQNQVNAKNGEENNHYDEIRAGYANELAQIREAMRETYEKEATK